jgi:hypothetical protein
MFMRRRGSSVYLVYDEDTFLAGRDSAGASAAGATPTRPSSVLRWTCPLLIAVIGSTGIQLWRSSSSEDHPLRSQAMARHGLPPARDIHRLAGRARDGQVSSERQVPTPSTTPSNRVSHHRRAHRARAADELGHPRRMTTARSPTPPVAVPASSARAQRQRSAPRTSAFAIQASASGEFGFEG